MPSLSKDDLLYQTENEVTPESLHSTAQQQTALEEKEKKAWKQEAFEAWEAWDKDSRGLGQTQEAWEQNIGDQMARAEKKLEWLAKAESARGAEDAAEPGRPKLLITPIFHDFFRFFPFSPGLLAVFPGFLASRR